MLVKVVNSKWTYFIILGLFIVVPAGIQLSQEYVGDNPPHGDWLGFWGSYFGIIPSGLIAYAVAKYQIEKDRETYETEKVMKSLPYFDIQLCGMNTSGATNVTPFVNMLTSTFSPEMPLRSIQFIIFMQSIENPHIYVSSPLNNVGHKMPRELGMLVSEPFVVPADIKWQVGRIDISIRLINGHSVFYTYGDGLIGHLIKNDVSKQIKLYDGVEKDKQKIIDRWNNLHSLSKEEID